ncbi:MAG: redoxin domain-containing protein [Candidatus Rokubacteria bacterium]|nr:redoxin domain-containing protein [Candidatus Rokubacteria bacterium]
MPALNDLGAQILAVSVDPQERSQQLADGLRLSYRFLSDRNLEVIRRYGLGHAGAGRGGRDIARPATIVVDKAGVIRWMSLPDRYSVRPDPQEIVAAVKALG